MPRVRPADTLAELREQFHRIIERVRALQHHDAASLGRRPHPTSWSAAECFAHLNLSIDPYFPLWRQELAPDRGAAAPPSRYRLDLWGRILVWTLEPPPRFSFSAPPPFQPVEVGVVEMVLPSFLERQDELLRVLDSVGNAPLDRIKIRSPFDRRVRYSIWSSFCVAAAHERRHLWQAQRALAVHA